MLEIIENGGTEDYEEDLNDLNYWFHVDRFDRKEANRRLYDYARGKEVFMWV